MSSPVLQLGQILSGTLSNDASVRQNAENALPEVSLKIFYYFLLRNLV